jgi:D-alanyl-D-alanine carboxypeptidase
VRARATAELTPSDEADIGLHRDGGGYTGPLAYRQGKPMRPDVALAFDRMAAAARREAGLYLLITSGYRSDAEQARLFAANPDPKWVAPPGQSLHRYGTELDLGPPAAYDWLEANSERFGFIKRYAWEDWHYGLPLAHKSALGLDRCAQRTIPHQAATLLLRAPRDGRPLQCSVSTGAALRETGSRTHETPSNAGVRPVRARLSQPGESASLAAPAPAD